MDEEQAQRQIQQMCNFILNEAKDKAQEIEAKALEDFNIEKLKLVQQMKDKILQEYQKKAKKLEADKSVSRSMAITRARLRKATAQHQLLEEVKEEAMKKLANVSNDKVRYRTFLIDSITEGLKYLLEPVVVILTREIDKNLVESLVGEASQKYSNLLKNQCNVSQVVKLVVNSAPEKFLPPPPSPSREGPYCCGGVKIMTPDGRIVCDNTIDTRLLIVLEECAPKIRKTLYMKE